MKKNKYKWKFIFILHNLSINEAIENDYVAIVPKTDSRIIELLKKHDTLNRLVSNFTDNFKRKVDPAILIVRDDAPSSVLDNESLVSFRNSLAICSIIKSWETFLNRDWQSGSNNYSDYFDIYPVSPDKKYKYLLTLTPSVRGLDTPEDFYGQTSPELATLNNSLEYDNEILDILFNRWMQRYVLKKRRNWENRVLFRSLEIACQACSIPTENNSTIYDIGSKISLWVSSFEVLVHPKIGQTNYERVFNLLSKANFISAELKKKYYRITKNRKRIGITLPQKLYYEIYNARNNFLHGNPVSSKDLYPFKNNKRYPLNFFAPLLYKVALICFLGIAIDIEDISILSNPQYFSLRNLEEGLLASLKDKRK